MRLLTFFGGPSDGRIKPCKVHCQFDIEIAFADDGIYEVTSDMAFFTGKTVKITRSTRKEAFPDFPFTFENPEHP
jgi:hypothetical protein